METNPKPASEPLTGLLYRREDGTEVPMIRDLVLITLGECPIIQTFKHGQQETSYGGGAAGVVVEVAEAIFNARSQRLVVSPEALRSLVRTSFDLYQEPVSGPTS